jgi:hypothetical protein
MATFILLLAFSEPLRRRIKAFEILNVSKLKTLALQNYQHDIKYVLHWCNGHPKFVTSYLHQASNCNDPALLFQLCAMDIFILILVLSEPQMGRNLGTSKQSNALAHAGMESTFMWLNFLVLSRVHLSKAD